MGQSRHRVWFAFEKLTRQPGGVETGGRGSGNLRVPAGGEQQGCGPEAQASVPLRPRKASGETDRARLCPQKLLGAHEPGGHTPSARTASGPGGTCSDCFTVCALQTEAMTSSSESVYFQIKGITFAYIPQQNLKFNFYNLILEKSQQFALEDDLRFPLLFWVKQPQTVTLGGDVNVNACACTHKCVHPL